MILFFLCGAFEEQLSAVLFISYSTLWVSWSAFNSEAIHTERYKQKLTMHIVLKI